MLVFWNLVFIISRIYFIIENSPEPLDVTIIHPDDYSFFYNIIPADIKDKNKIKQIAKTIDKSIFNGNKKYILDFLNDSFIIHFSTPLKQYTENVIPENSHVNSILEGRVVSITDFGAFIDVNLCENAFLYKNEMTSEILKRKGYSDGLKIGDYVTVKVTYKEYKNLIFVNDEIDDREFNIKYHEYLGKNKKHHPFECIIFINII